MARPGWQSRIALWIPVALGIASSFLTVVAILMGPISPWWLLRVPLDLIATAGIRRRRWRFASAVWFGINGFVLVASVAAGSIRRGAMVAAAVFTATALATLWPRLRGAREDAPLPPLPGTWVLLSTLAVVVMNGLLVRGNPEQISDAQGVIFQSGAATLLLFGCLMIASLTGRARWLFQIAGTLLAGTASLAHASMARGLSEAANPGWDLSWLFGAVPFALGFDWIRSGCTSLSRVARATLLCFASAFIPALIASGQQAVSAQILGVALSRAVAFGICAGLAPRVRGRMRPGFRRQPPLFGWAPRATLLLGLAVVAGVVGLGVVTGEHGVMVGAVLLGGTLFLAIVLRARLTRALLWLAAAAPVCVFGTAALHQRENTPMLLGWVASLLAVAGISAVLSGTRATQHFSRRARPILNPAPRISAALVGSVLGAVTVAVAINSRTPVGRSKLLDRVEGPTALNAALMFDPPAPRGKAALESDVGASMALDPLGRGTWVVDEETDTVRLLSKGNSPRSLAVSAGPQQLVIDETGRAFVACRKAGRIDVIDPDFRRHTIEVGTEVRGLALDTEHHRLFAGLLLERELWAIDTRTGVVVGRRSMEVEPRTLAVTPLGVAVLPDRGGSVVFVKADLSASREVPLFSAGRQSWHGQALLPIGRDLIVIHQVVDTGLSQPVASGGYGGSVRQPVELVASVLHDGEPIVYPLSIDARRAIPGAEITGIAASRRSLLLTSLGTGEILEVPWERLYTASEKVIHRLAVDGPAGIAHTPEGALVTLATFSRKVIQLDSSASAVAAETSLGKGRLDPQMALGRRLFHQANRREISSAALACSTCHTDGREDGLVWRLQGLRLQTPSLAGRLADTAPYNWHGTEATVEGNVRQTIARLGGTGISNGEARALARFIRDGLAEPHRRDVGPSPLVAQGARLFHDQRVGCAGCHLSDAAFTDGARHDVGSLSQDERREIETALEAQRDTAAAQKGARPVVDLKDATMGFDTPSLRHVGLTAPYFHDGSAPTLAALVENNHDRMGHTSQLTLPERAALVAYLQTL